MTTTQSGASRREGAVLFKVLICLAMLTGMLALNLDGGRMLDERRRVQATADAAALAAASRLYEQYWDAYGADGDSSARQAALDCCAAAGYPASAVTVNIPPLSGEYLGKPGHVEVLIRTSLDASFGRVFTGQPLSVGGRSVGRGGPLDIGIIALNRTAANAVDNSALALAVVNKPIIVNSTHTSAFRHTGLLALVASRLEVTGGVSISSLLNISRVRTGVPPTLDPLAYLPIPEGGPVRASTPTVINSLLPVILQPGRYRGGLRITGASVVVMLPGTYIMEGGGFIVDGAATVTGLLTTVYNTTHATYAPGPFKIEGLGKAVLSAPLSGPYQGISLFQNRAMTQPVSVKGVGLTVLTGTIYAASAAAVLNGTANANVDILGGAYVVDTFKSTGVGFVTLNLNLNPPRVPDVRLVE